MELYELEIEFRKLLEKVQDLYDRVNSLELDVEELQRDKEDKD